MNRVQDIFRPCFYLIAMSVCCCLPSLSIAQEKPEGDQKKERATHVVKSGYFEVIEKVPAIVESRSMAEVQANLKNWSGLEIKSILEEGTSVKDGQEVVWFETDDLDKKLKESRQSLALGGLNLKASELEFDLVQQTFDLDVTMMEKQQKQLEEDYKYFVDVERPNQEENARRSVLNSQHSLEYAQEEFNQLSRMYSEDELTEESEEIVLKRTKRGVENSQFYLKQAQIRAARTLETELPRRAEQKKSQLERARIEFAKNKVEMPLNRDKKGIELDRARLALENQRQELDELEQDRKAMTLTSPMAGILYFGRCERGKWMGQNGPNRDLRKGRKVTANKVFLTVVDPNQLFLRADLDESQLAMIKSGSEGVVTPKAFPKSKVAARVSKVNYVPIQQNKFDCQIDLATVPSGVMPGMTCDVRFTLAQKEDAITVPAGAVFSNDGVKHFVYVVDGDSQRMQTVEVGLKSGDKIEITSGLSAGDEILTERPE